MEKIKVLLIEDNPGDARLIKEMLAEAKSVSFDFEWKDNLTKGLKRLTEKGIDVVLLDLMLPDSAGAETFVKTHACAPHVPILVLTGLDDETVAIGAVKEGAQDYLIKGQIDSNLLIHAVRYAIERMRIKEQLKESEMRYRTLFEQSLDGVLIIDPLTAIAIEFNEAAYSQLGYTQEEFKNFRIFDYEAKEKFDDTKFHIEKIIREGRDEFETLHRTKDGKLRNVMVAVQKIELSGKVVFHCIFHDITEEKQAVEAVRESEHRSREMLQNIQLIGIMLDANNNIIFCNDFLLKLTGWHREEVTGQNWFKMFVPQERQEERRLVFHQLLVRGAPFQFETEILTKRGDRHLISFNNVVLRDLRGSITGIASIGDDITMRRQV